MEKKTRISKADALMAAVAILVPGGGIVAGFYFLRKYFKSIDKDSQKTDNEIEKEKR